MSISTVHNAWAGTLHLIGCGLIGLLLTACPAVPPIITPATPTAGAEPTTAPPATATTASPSGGDVGELETLVAASLGITTSIPATYTIGMEGVRAFALAGDRNGQPYWVAYTYGLRDFSLRQNHTIALYTQSADGWQEVARLELADNGDPQNPVLAPDYVGDGGVTQVSIEPTLVWIQVEGGVGAHSGVYGLFSFDGALLTPQVVGFNASPGLARLADLNDDGLQEVILNASDPYVFCYACGVRLVQYALWRWDGAQMMPVTLAPLPADAPAELAAANDQALQLAAAGLWQDALATIETADALGLSDPSGIYDWNSLYLRLNAEAKRDAASEENSAYPLINHIFYGDYAAALEILRAAGADAIFIPNSPLIAGTVAEGWEPTLADWILGATEPALALQPDLAAAHFLRGWANYLKTGDLAAALPAVQQAATLAPDELLYPQSVDFLGSE